MQLSIIKITRQKVVYNHLGADSLYFIYHSREIVSFPLHIVNVTIAKAAQMQFACRGDTRMENARSNQAGWRRR